jgi:hypothetical protein
MTEQQVPFKAIKRLVEYLYPDESQNYGGEDDHIFRAVHIVAAWLDCYDDIEPLESYSVEE